MTKVVFGSEHAQLSAAAEEVIAKQIIVEKSKILIRENIITILFYITKSIFYPTVTE